MPHKSATAPLTHPAAGAPPQMLRSACPLDCPDACSLEIEVKGGRVTRVDGTRANPYTAGYVCSKVRHFDRHMYAPERLLRPALRRGRKGGGDFEEVSWDEALGAVAERLAADRGRHGGESILPFSYGGSNGFLTQDTTDARLFHRLGASRLLRNVCAAPSTAAAQGMYGKMVGVDLADYVHARLILVWGANPATTGIHLVPVLKEARRRGAKLVVVDPRRTQQARQADVHLAPRPGTDLPLALSVVRWLFETGRADERFLAEHATGADELRRRAEPWSIERAAGECGVEAARIQALAELYAESSPAVIRCGWGPERNRNGGSAIAAILSLPAVAGKFGVRGGGYTMSNTRSWSIDSLVAAGEPPPATRAVNMNHLGRALCGEADPPIHSLFVYNSNPLATLPEQRRVRRGLSREDLFTVVFDQVLTDTARYADVLLPATTFLEHTELRRSYGSTALLLADAVVQPAGEARPNYAVFGELCERLGLNQEGEAVGAEELTEALLDAGEVSPAARAELAAEGRTFPWKEAPPVPFVDHFPGTPDGRVHLVPEALEREAAAGLYRYLPDPATDDFPLALISPATARTISSTFGQLVREHVPLSIHPSDAAPRGIEDGCTVRVYNALGEVRCPAALDPDLRAGTVLLPKGLWSHSTENGETSNALVPDALSDVGRGACFNDARVEVERV